MNKSTILIQIREAVLAKLNEGVMAYLDIIAQESTSFDEFVNKVKTDPDNDINTTGAAERAFLQQIYDQAQDLNEISVIRGLVRKMVKEVLESKKTSTR